MIEHKLNLRFSSLRKSRHLRHFTFVMFMFLVMEKILTSASVNYQSGEMHFYFILKELDILSIFVYLSMAMLIALKVKYKYLLIPDFVLLGIKIYSIVNSTLDLTSVATLSVIYKLSAIETIVESTLFSLFLIILFLGKLIHTNNFFHKRYPVYCIRFLLFCFPVTVVFEVIKIFVATEMHQNTILMILNFAKAVLNEAFLDLPYILLVLLICFVKQENSN